MVGGGGWWRSCCCCGGSSTSNRTAEATAASSSNNSSSSRCSDSQQQQQPAASSQQPAASSDNSQQQQPQQHNQQQPAAASSSISKVYIRRTRRENSALRHEKSSGSFGRGGRKFGRRPSAESERICRILQPRAVQNPTNSAAHWRRKIYTHNLLILTDSVTNSSFQFCRTASCRNRRNQFDSHEINRTKDLV